MNSIKTRFGCKLDSKQLEKKMKSPLCKNLKLLVKLTSQKEIQI